MFNFKKKIQKDPICGMIANDKFISEYGENSAAEIVSKHMKRTGRIAKKRRLIRMMRIADAADKFL